LKIKTSGYIFDKTRYDVIVFSKTIRVVLKRQPKFKGNKKSTKEIDTGVKIIQGVTK